MSIQPFKKISNKISLILVILSSVTFVFAEQPYPDKDLSQTKRERVITRQIKPAEVVAEKEENLSVLQKQARLYRIQGLGLQNIGDLERALSLYQKAIELDPAYAVVYNDLGIIYEIRGSLEQAEESYLKSIKINPHYLSAYSNLALLYENKRQLDKAAFYWRKRAKLGTADDPWTQKAKQRLGDIEMVQQDYYFASREQEVIGLVEDVTVQKSILGEDNKALAQKYFTEAKRNYKNKDYAAAIKKALDAQQLEPNNKEIEAFIDKVQLRALSH